MSFNEGVKSDSGRVRTSRGKTGAALGGGSLLLVVGLFVLSQITGINFMGLATGGNDQPAEETRGIDLSHCQTGADANEHEECRMVTTADSLDAVWVEQLAAQQSGASYEAPGFQIFEDAVSTQCGQATSAVGPFYCPADRVVYLDMGFFQQMEDQLGAANAPLAQEYVIAHEWGHHIQNLQGIFGSRDQRDTGPQGEAVRIELQADCYAGIWMNHASQTLDPDSGEPFLKPPSDKELQEAWQTAEAIGDDRIQEKSGQVNPESWTHGSAEQRQRWLKIGVDGGSIAQCDTFAVDEV